MVFYFLNLFLHFNIPQFSKALFFAGKYLQQLEVKKTDRVCKWKRQTSEACKTTLNILKNCCDEFAHYKTVLLKQCSERMNFSRGL